MEIKWFGAKRRLVRAGSIRVTELIHRVYPVARYRVVETRQEKRKDHHHRHHSLLPLSIGKGFNRDANRIIQSLQPTHVFVSIYEDNRIRFLFPLQFVRTGIWRDAGRVYKTFGSFARLFEEWGLTLPWLQFCFENSISIAKRFSTWKLWQPIGMR